LSRAGTRWKKLNYFQGHKPLKGLSFKARDGLDRMVGFGGDQHYDGNASWISAVSYKDNVLHEEPLLGVSGNSGGAPAAGYCYQQDIDTFEKLPSKTGIKVVVKQIRGLAPSGEKSCGYRNPYGASADREFVFSI